MLVRLECLNLNILFMINEGVVYIIKKSNTLVYVSVKLVVQNYDLVPSTDENHRNNILK